MIALLASLTGLTGRAARAECDPKSFLNFLTVHPKLLRVGHSRVVDEALSNQGSAFRKMYDTISTYEKRAFQQDVSFEDRKNIFAITLHTLDDETLEITIHAIIKKGTKMGKSSDSLNSSFVKFVGSILQGIDQNIARVPNQFKSVRIIGSQVVNKKLEKTLIDLGFRESSEISKRFFNSTKGSSGYAKGLAAKTVGINGFKLNPVEHQKLFMVTPILTGSIKKSHSAIKYVAKKAPGIDLMIEIPLRQP